ncbi:MAG: hypothetical protein ACLUD2_06080 [Clostridium sp.]
MKISSAAALILPSSSAPVPARMSAGEETALFESIEGKRGEPRFRPPFLASRACLESQRC